MLEQKYSLPFGFFCLLEKSGPEFYIFQFDKQYKQKMNFKVWLLVALTILATAQEEEFIDFTYTQLLQEASSTSKPKEKIVIHPDTQQFWQYQFPEVCQLQAQLGESQPGQGTVDNFFNMDHYFEQVRDKIMALLKLAEEIKHSRNYLNEISKHLELREQTPLQDHFKVQLQELGKKESQLSESKLKIESMTADLNRRIEGYNANPKNQQLKIVSLNYEIQALNSKIAYLKELKEKSIQKAQSQPNTNFTEFFTRLGLDLNKQSDQIELLDRYFQNVSQLNFLKDTASSLRDNIQVDRLNIQYKKTCLKEKEEFISRSSSHAEIKETLTHLRDKKKQLGNITNKYCQGVARKLEMQIKRLLKAINWTFTCSQGLEELQEKKKSEELKLAEIEKQINNYGNEGINQYQANYESIKNRIEHKMREIPSFTIDQYNHNPADLEQLIKGSQQKKRDAEDKLNSCSKQMSGEGVYSEIKELASQIKKQKGRFCQDYSHYEQQMQKLWFLIYNQENTRSFSARMRGEYIRESKKLEELENEYKALSQNVIAQLMETGSKDELIV